MRLEYEVVRLCGGHLFDAESYELTLAGGLLSKRGPGYYVVLRSPASQRRSDGAAVESIGPFSTAEHAARVMRDLRRAAGTMGGETDDRPAVPTIPRDRETIS
ncbi:MAG TPA: hypothetical protein VF814_09130 [Casimicrobiaceae bacterium]